MRPNCEIRSSIFAPRLTFLFFSRFTRLAAARTIGLNAARGERLYAGPRAPRICASGDAFRGVQPANRNFPAAALCRTLILRFLQACFEHDSLSCAPRGTFVTYIRVTRLG